MHPKFDHPITIGGILPHNYGLNVILNQESSLINNLPSVSSSESFSHFGEPECRREQELIESIISVQSFGALATSGDCSSHGDDAQQAEIAHSICNAR